jgi:hypothetical protein
MTEAYGVSFKNAKEKYLKYNQKKLLNKEKFNELVIIFKKFFYFLKKNPLLFKKEPKTIINAIKCNSKIILKNKENANLHYFKHIKIQKSYYINNIRHTKQQQILSTAIDFQKMKIAARANYVQLLESAVARYVLIKCNTPIIHDCFTIDYFNVPYLLSIVNEAMNINFHQLRLKNFHQLRLKNFHQLRLKKNKLIVFKFFIFGIFIIF